MADATPYNDTFDLGIGLYGGYDRLWREVVMRVL